MGNPMRTLLPVVPVLALSLATVLMSGCGSEEKSSRGLELLPDMFHTQAHKSQTSVSRQEKAADGTIIIHETPVMLEPVPGTVPRNFVPYSLAPTDWAAAKLLRNPLEPSAVVLRLGQTRFNQTCATCHGRDGDASHGNVAKYFSGIPSINTANVVGMTDGEVYHIATLGRNRMPSLRSQLLPAERWSVVAYVKSIARATLAATEAKGLEDAAWKAAQANPGDAAAVEALTRAKTVVAQRQADIDAITAVQASGVDAAKDFAPLPEPVPEGVAPSWNPNEKSHAAGEGTHE